jgi:hypothetical protein
MNRQLTKSSAVGLYLTGKAAPPEQILSADIIKCEHPRISRRNRFLIQSVSRTPTVNKNETQRTKELLC